MNVFNTNYALFLGKEEDGYTSEFVGGETFFLTAEARAGLSKEQVRSLLHNIEAEIQRTDPKTLSDLKDIVEGTFSTVETSEDNSFAGGLIVDTILYVVTKGKGEILLQRNKKLVPIISGDSNASGHIIEGDIIIFTSSHLTDLVEDKKFESYIDGHTPKEIVEEITPHLKEHDDKGTVALFLQFVKGGGMEETAVVIDEIPPRRKFSFPRIPLTPDQLSKRRKLTFAIVFILFAILIWSVGFGVQRRTKALQAKKISAAQESIHSKLTEAKDLSALNPDHSVELLNQAKSELSQVRHEVGDNKNELLIKLSQEVDEAEKQILHKDEKSAEVFYELSLIEKGATAKTMYLEDTTLSLLNTDGGKVYQLDIGKKSAQTVKKGEYSGASKAASYSDSIFVLKSDGVYKTDSDGKTSRVFQNDEWGRAVDIAVFNGNIYILDPQRDEIYKYLVAESGYSDKISYIKSGGVNLERATSMAIDSSIYVSLGARIAKFTSGLRDSFDFNPPTDKSFNFDKVFADQSNENVYLLDKSLGEVIVTGKNGTYQRQISSSVLSKALDFVVVEESENAGIYVLTGDKIYRIGL